MLKLIEHMFLNFFTKFLRSQHYFASQNLGDSMLSTTLADDYLEDRTGLRHFFSDLGWILVSHFFGLGIKCRLLISSIFYALNFRHILEMMEFNL